MNIFRHNDGRCYHINIKQGDIPPYILSCGAPERVAALGKYLQEVQVLSENRGLLCLRGKYKGLPIAVFCSGMGPASVAITLPEILDSVAPAQRQTVSVLRLGTAGSLQSRVKLGDLVVAQGSVRDEATTQKWIGLEYPAVAGTRLALATLAAGVEKGLSLGKNLWYGMVHVKDELYAIESPANSPLAETRTQALKSFKRMGTLATEMESSVFSIYGDLLAAQGKQNPKDGFGRIETGCVTLVVSPCHDENHLEPAPFTHPDPVLGMEVVLEALWIKSRLDQGELPATLKEVMKSL